MEWNYKSNPGMFVIAFKTKEWSIEPLEALLPLRELLGHKWTLGTFLRPLGPLMTPQEFRTL